MTTGNVFVLVDPLSHLKGTRMFGYYVDINSDSFARPDPSLILVAVSLRQRNKRLEDKLSRAQSVLLYRNILQQQCMLVH